MRGRGRPRHPDVLTPRQWEVLGLVREGLTNEEIADRLGISERGAKFHVSEILGKLGIANRYEAASWQPAEPAAARERRPWALALAPFGALRRLHWNAAAQVAAVAGTLVVAAGIAALAWGVMQTQGSSGGSGSPAEALRTASSSLVIGSPAALSPPGGAASHTAEVVAQPVSETPVSHGCVSLNIAPDTASRATVNADGDGTPDEATVYFDANAERWYLQLALDGASNGIWSEVSEWPDPGPLRVIGGYDVNGDGRDEIFVNDGRGAYTRWIDVYEFDAATCQLVRLAAPDPAGNINPPQFAVGASVLNGAGLTCSDGKLVSFYFGGTSDDPPIYSETRTTYAIDGTALRVVSTENNIPMGTTEPDPAFDCDGLTLAR